MGVFAVCPQSVIDSLAAASASFVDAGSIPKDGIELPASGRKKFVLLDARLSRIMSSI
jgi:hypothetical protein